jgi:hypothetical protein
MESEGEILNKGYIVRKLRERGLSRRRSVQLLNFILGEAAAALARGEEMEFPFGSLKRVHHPHKKQQGRFLDKITTIYKKPYTVALEVDAEGEMLLKKRRSKVAASDRGAPGLYRSSNSCPSAFPSPTDSVPMSTVRSEPGIRCCPCSARIL